MYFAIRKLGGGPDPTFPGITGTVTTRDIVRFDPVPKTFVRFFQGSAVGVPAAAQIDSFAKLPNGDLLLSFTNYTGSLAFPNSLSVTTADVLRFHPTTPGVYSAGTFSFFMRGSDIGLDGGTNENLDGIFVDGVGDVYFSTDGDSTYNANVSGLASSNGSDIVKFHPTSSAVHDARARSTSAARTRASRPRTT